MPSVPVRADRALDLRKRRAGDGDVQRRHQRAERAGRTAIQPPAPALGSACAAAARGAAMHLGAPVAPARSTMRPEEGQTPRGSTPIVTESPGSRRSRSVGSAFWIEPHADAHRHALDDLREVAGGVLRRQQRELRAGAGREASTVPTQDVYLVANFKETQIGRMRAGQPVTLHVDALPDLDLHGTVESFSPGTGAQFALLPSENATGNFTKIVQRVPVRIRVRARSEGGPDAARPPAARTLRDDRRGHPRSPPWLRPHRRPRRVQRVRQARKLRRARPRTRRAQRRHGRLDRRRGRRARRADGDAGHLHHQLGAAADPGRDRRDRHRGHLDLHRLPDVGDRHDPAGRVAHARLRAAQPPGRQRGAVHLLLGAVRPLGQPADADPRPHRARLHRRRDDPHRADHHPHAAAAPSASRRHDAVRIDRAARAAAGPGARRLADRERRLALVLLHQRAGLRRAADAAAAGTARAAHAPGGVHPRRLARHRGPRGRPVDADRRARGRPARALVRVLADRVAEPGLGDRHGDDRALAALRVQAHPALETDAQLALRQRHRHRVHRRRGAVPHLLPGAAVPRVDRRLQRAAVGRDHAAGRRARLPDDAHPAAADLPRGPARDGDPRTHGLRREPACSTSASPPRASATTSSARSCCAASGRCSA